MITNLPERVRSMADLAVNCKSKEGRAYHLQRFLFALMSEKRYGYAIFYAYQKLLKGQEESVEMKRRAYSWLQNQVEKLSKSQAAEVPFVAEKIRDFRMLITGKKAFFSQSFLNSCIYAYKQVLFAIQRFGEIKLLNDLADFDETNDVIDFPASEFPLRVNEKVCLSPWMEEGKSLTNQLERGFSSATLEKIQLSNGSEVIRCHLQSLTSLTPHWPDDIDLLLEKENSRLYQASIEKSVGQALGLINFIIQLCNQELLNNGQRWHWQHTSDPIRLDSNIEQWISMRYLLSLGEKDDPLEIFTPEAIKELIELFSNLASSITYHPDEVFYQKWKSWLSKIVAEYAEGMITAWLLKKEPEVRRLIRKKDAYNWLIRTMEKQEIPAEIIECVTKTLITETVCPQVRKNIKWRPMRDGPNRQELLKKHGPIS